MKSNKLNLDNFVKYDIARMMKLLYTLKKNWLVP